MSRSTKLAIILPFNDVDEMHGGSRNGIKGRISYFDQFLMLYESILENWKSVNFKYRLIVLHSLPFNEEKRAILDQLDVEVVRADYDEHPLKIRPAAYTMNFDCDFRLILDVDMIALKKPEFDFNVDAQAVYGGNKYKKKQWRNICEYIGCKLPKFVSLKLKNGQYRSWSCLEHYLYQAGWIRWRIFPYFNNGAILIRNALVAEVGAAWLEYRRRYTQYVQETQRIDIDLEGQDVIGLAINHVVNNWAVFPRGFNYALNDSFSLGSRMNSNKAKHVSMFHYINVKEGTHFYQLVDNYYKKIRNKYYL